MCLLSCFGKLKLKYKWMKVMSLTVTLQKHKNSLRKPMCVKGMTLIFNTSILSIHSYHDPHTVTFVSNHVITL